MTGVGRPFRFLAIVLGGWVAMRVVMLWPAAERMVEVFVPNVLTRPTAAVRPLPRHRPIDIQRPSSVPSPRVPIGRRAARIGASEPARPAATPPLPRTTMLPTAASGSPVGIAPTRASRWSASAWLIARGTGSATLAPGGTLGGSQAGVRVAWRPVTEMPVALFGRISRPLREAGAEAAIGIEAQPLGSLPMRLALEQRFALEAGAAEGTAVSVIGGVSDITLPGGFSLDGYGQAGIIGLRRRAGFVDGAASVTKPLVSFGDTHLRLGAGVWGAAQPGLSRLDIGPRAEMRVPVAGQRLRLGVEWRERIAGNARPGSGPALTIGADF